MPIYEYACHDCQHEFEALLRGADAPACPACQGRHLAKLFSVPAAPSSQSASQYERSPADSSCQRPQCGGGRCAGF